MLQRAITNNFQLVYNLAVGVLPVLCSVMENNIDQASRAMSPFVLELHSFCHSQPLWCM